MTRFSMLVAVPIICFMLVSTVLGSETKDLKLSASEIYLRDKMKGIEDSNKKVLAEVRNIYTLLKSLSKKDGCIGHASKDGNIDKHDFWTKPEPTDATPETKKKSPFDFSNFMSTLGGKKEPEKKHKTTSFKNTKASDLWPSLKHQDQLGKPKTSSSLLSEDVISFASTLSRNLSKDRFSKAPKEDGTTRDSGLKPRGKDACPAQKEDVLLVSTLTNDLAVVKLDDNVVEKTVPSERYCKDLVYDGVCSVFCSTKKGTERIPIPDYEKRERLAWDRGYPILDIDRSLQRLYILSFICVLRYVDLHTMKITKTKSEYVDSLCHRGLTDLMVDAKNRKLYVNDFLGKQMTIIDYEGHIISKHKTSDRVTSMVAAPKFNQFIGCSKTMLVTIPMTDPTARPSKLAKIAARKYTPTAFSNDTLFVGGKSHVQVYTFDGHNLKTTKRMEIKHPESFAILKTQIKV